MPEPTFEYRARDPHGHLVRGRMQAAAAALVRQRLREAGLEIESVRPGRTLPAWLRGSLLLAWWQAQRRRSHRPALADILESLQTLLGAGVPLETAVGNLAASPARPAGQRAMLADLREEVRQGQAFSEACTRHPDWFDRFDVAMLAAGQTAGDLPRVLASLSHFHQQASGMSHRLLMALAYPVVLTVAATAVALFISQSTLPRLLALLAESRAPQPWLSLMVVRIGDAVMAWWPVLLAAGLGTILLGRNLLGRLSPHSWISRTLHGNVVARARARSRVAEVAGALARLQSSGLPLAEALDIAASAAGSRPLAALLEQAAQAVRRGDDLSTVVAASPLLDPEFAQILRLGEESGELPTMLDRIADRYRAAASRSMDRVAAVLEPAAILILAAIIAVVVMAAALPLVALGQII